MSLETLERRDKEAQMADLCNAIDYLKDELPADFVYPRYLSEMFTHDDVIAFSVLQMVRAHHALEDGL